VSATTCKQVVENLGSSSPVKDLFYALKVNGILKCKVNADVFKVILYYGYLFMIRLRFNVMAYEIYSVWKLMLQFAYLVKDIAVRLKATVNDASTLVDMYYSIGSLVLIKVIP